ncbi:MAG: hypothetical protein E7Z77_02470 [Methanobrevibacter sp.]|uniref:hypothetical protein n=1 Tax=Methanobrevibacter sp. TaxID=66852 RepID=UPI0025D85EE3|nr:hypothetical protein [Methanobrevibacter sp.]MBE6508259.1 hypothetical protein [Methanobrevibacter sp.]
MVLRKEDILGGINHIQQCHIESLGGEIYLKPLSESQLNELDLIEAKAMGVYESSQRGRSDALNKGKINLAKATEASNEAKIAKIRLSINNDKNPDEWSEEEIGSLPRNAIEELIEKINEISGIDTTTREVEKFPEDQ